MTDGRQNLVHTSANECDNSDRSGCEIQRNDRPEGIQSTSNNDKQITQ